ncbi:MAG: hypothetical protein AB1439_04520 [candidate division FCPU426 bacterium]
MIRRATLFLCILACLGTAWPLPASGVWEHSQVSEATRLPAGREVWEFGLVYTMDAMYPIRFTCPAGVRVILHALNLSPLPIYLERKDTGGQFALPSGAYRRLDFGLLAAGDHGFDLVIPMSADAGHSSHADEKEPGRLRCQLLADTWPGESLPFEAVWMVVGKRLLPERVVLPAGRPVSLFIGAAVSASADRLPLNDQWLQVKPADVSLTELQHPQGGRITVPFPPSRPAELDIR